MSEALRLEGKVTKGRLDCDPVEWAIAMQEYEGVSVVVTIDRKRATRTPRANRRHWTVIVPLVRHCINRKRPDMLPFNKDEIHRLIATAFGGSDETELGPVPIRTRTMDTRTFWHMDEQAGLWLMEQGYSVPEGREETVERAIEEAMS